MYSLIGCYGYVQLLQGLPETKRRDVHRDSAAFTVWSVEVTAALTSPANEMSMPVARLGLKCDKTLDWTRYLVMYLKNYALKAQ